MLQGRVGLPVCRECDTPSLDRDLLAAWVRAKIPFAR
jgi:hypothetical protein